jgi:pimeloyl-ACP methyl ester carboxylesterase
VTVLAWQRASGAGAGSVVLVHGWGGDGPGEWQGGWVERLTRAGFDVLVPDLPGHGESADVVPPADAEPAAWTAGVIRDDLPRLRAGTLLAVGHAEGGVVAGHLAVSEALVALALVACDDAATMANAGEVAAALRDPAARVWHPDAAERVARARRDRRHDRDALAGWAERARWPAAARLGALRTPVLLAAGADDATRERAPRLAGLFHDAHLATVPGAGLEALSSMRMVATVTRFLSDAALTGDGAPEAT